MSMWRILRTLMPMEPRDHREASASARSAASPVPCTIYVSYASIYLHDEGSREGPPARHQSARRHLVVVLLRRQDWRARPERRGEELAPEDHVGRVSELHRRSVSWRKHLDRLPAPGAAARSEEERPRQRRGGRRRDQGAACALRPSQQPTRRASI